LERDHRGLRSPLEIASRLCALDALFVWVVEEEAHVPEAGLRSYVERSALDASMTPEERAIWESPRAAARRHQSSIGWRLENEWSLAWALGFERNPDASGEMIDRETSRALVLDFLPKHTSDVEAFLGRVSPRSEDEIDALEDLFYCAHNAARSAQLGGATVPSDFHPIAGGGVICERRHALLWCLSPGVAWDDVELST